MSNSIITNYAAVSVDQKVDGQYIYLLYTEGYEKNVYPHTPTWSLIFIGNYDDCWRKIVWFASFCEHGSTETKSGRTISPSDGVDSWRNAFRNVGKLSDTIFEIKFGKGFYDVPVEFKEHFNSVFIKNGFDRADRSFDLNSASVLRAITELFSPAMSIPVDGSYWPLSYAYWQVLSDIPRERHADFPMPEASVNHVNQKSTLLDLLDIEVFFIEPDSDFIMFVNQELFGIGPNYSIIQMFLVKYAMDHEIERHGSFHHLYKEIVKIVSAPLILPEGSTLIFKKPDDKFSSCSHQYWESFTSDPEVITLDENSIMFSLSRYNDVYGTKRYPCELTSVQINRDRYTRPISNASQISLLG